MCPVSQSFQLGQHILLLPGLEVPFFCFVPFYNELKHCHEVISYFQLRVVEDLGVC